MLSNILSKSSKTVDDILFENTLDSSKNITNHIDKTLQSYLKKTNIGRKTFESNNTTY